MLKVAFDPMYVHPLPESHRFPMQKYDLLPKQLMYEGTLEESNFFRPDQMTLEDIQLVHTSEYVEKLFELKVTEKEQRATGFVHSKALIDREALIMEGTRLCAESALKCGAAMNIAGGTHHAFKDRGEGFCLLNDQAIAASWLIKQQLVEKVLIIDLDVHQGNGTAAIFRDVDSVYTFSMHGEQNYPLQKEKSDLDIPLKDGVGDKEYLYSLEKGLAIILANFAPDFIFYQSGVDVLASDKLGRMNINLAGCKQRDRVVIETAKELGVPIVCTMGGGYSADIKQIIEAHANTFRLVQEILF